MSQNASEPRWPGETMEYRVARDALAQAEHELARAAEAVAAQRRALPLAVRRTIGSLKGGRIQVLRDLPRA